MSGGRSARSPAAGSAKRQAGTGGGSSAWWAMSWICLRIGDESRIASGHGPAFGLRNGDSDSLPTPAAVRAGSGGTKRRRRPGGPRSADEAVAEHAVVRAVGPHRGGQRGVAAAASRRPVFASALPRQKWAKSLTGARSTTASNSSRALEAAAAEVGAAERLADRGLVGLEPAGALERDGRRGEVAALEQLAAARVQVVDVVGASPGLVDRAPPLGRRSRSGPHAFPLRPGWQPPRGLGAPSARRVAAPRVTIVTSLSSVSKPMSGLRDVVVHDGVEALALELPPRVLQARPRRARPRTRPAPGRPAPAPRGRPARRSVGSSSSGARRGPPS